MKKKLLFIAAAVLGLAGCQKYELNTDFTMPTELESPSNVILDVTSSKTVVLSWTGGGAEDGGVLLYNVLFDKQGGDFSEPVTQNTKRFVRCFWGLDKSLAYARHFPAIHWLTSYSEYLDNLAGWYTDNVGEDFVDCRNQLVAILNQESSLMEIVKLIGSDVLPDDQKLTLEIARVIRLGFLQQNAFHPEDTCVPLSKQLKMMETILYLNKKARALVTMGMPMSVLKESNIFERVIAIKYDVPNDHLELFDDYRKEIDAFYDEVLEKNA